MPFNKNDPSFGTHGGPFIKEESQLDGIKQLAAANLYVLSGGHDFSPKFVLDFEPQNIFLLQPFHYLQNSMDIDVNIKKKLRRSR